MSTVGGFPGWQAGGRERLHLTFSGRQQLGGEHSSAGDRASPGALRQVHRQAHRGAAAVRRHHHLSCGTGLTVSAAVGVWCLLAAVHGRARSAWIMAGAAGRLALWAPRLGRSVASAQLQPRPMIGVPYVATCAAAWYAATAMSRAVCGDAYEAGAAPPSNPAKACCAYGTRTSSTVRDAPGTVSSHDNACTITVLSLFSRCSRPGWNTGHTCGLTTHLESSAGGMHYSLSGAVVDLLDQAAYVLIHRGHSSLCCWRCC